MTTTTNVEWIPILDTNEEKDEGLTVMSYNLLAQNLVKRELFPYCDRATLRWKTRRGCLLSEFQSLNPDIACLQEVGNFEEYFQAQFKKLGYQSIYFSHPTKVHGCCIIFKGDKFECISQSSINLDETEIVKDKTLPRSTNTGNIGLILTLQTKAEPSKKLIVSTTHLYWRPDCDYERLRQIVVMTNAIQNFALQYSAKVPVLFCGDFNSQPYKFPYKAVTHYQPFNKETFDNMVSDLEAMYLEYTREVSSLELEISEKTATSKLQEAGSENVLEEPEADSKNVTLELTKPIPPELRKLESRYSELSKILKNKPQLLSPQGLYNLALSNPRLLSTYGNYSKFDKKYLLDDWETSGILEPKYTHYTADFRFPLDYIFQLEGHTGLVPTHLLQLPDPDTFGPGLPSPIYPSDHLPIMAHFKWI